MKNLLRITLYGILLTTPLAGKTEEQIRYVRDFITVPLRQSASADSGIAHPGVSSGTVVTVIKEDAETGFTRVRTSEGAEGWIATRHLSAEPIARVQLEKANAELEALRKANAQLEQEQANMPSDQRSSAQKLTQLQNDNAQMQEELQTLRQAPDNATQLAQENIELKKSNTELQAQVMASTKTLGDLQRANDFTLFREGALAVIGGAVLAALIPRLRPKKRSEWV